MSSPTIPQDRDAAALVMHVERGNQRVVLPVIGLHALTVPVTDLAALIIGELIAQAELEPGRADNPPVRGSRRYALRLRGRDNTLDPDKPLLPQTNGAWRVETLPVQGQGQATARLPVAPFELVDVDRDVIRLVHG